MKAFASHFLRADLGNAYDLEVFCEAWESGSELEVATKARKAAITGLAIGKVKTTLRLVTLKAELRIMYNNGRANLVAKIWATYREVNGVPPRPKGEQIEAGKKRNVINDPDWEVHAKKMQGVSLCEGHHAHPLAIDLSVSGRASLLRMTHALQTPPLARPRRRRSCGRQRHLAVRHAVHGGPVLQRRGRRQRQVVRPCRPVLRCDRHGFHLPGAQHRRGCASPQNRKRGAHGVQHDADRPLRHGGEELACACWRPQPTPLPAGRLALAAFVASSLLVGAHGRFLPATSKYVRALLTITVLLHVVSDARQDQAHPPRGYQQPRLFRLRAQVSNATPGRRSSKKAVMIQFR